MVIIALGRRSIKRFSRGAYDWGVFSFVCFVLLFCFFLGFETLVMPCSLGSTWLSSFIDRTNIQYILLLLEGVCMCMDIFYRYLLTSIMFTSLRGEERSFDWNSLFTREVPHLNCFSMF